jgi:hypothetical protein
VADYGRSGEIRERASKMTGTGPSTNRLVAIAKSSLSMKYRYSVFKYSDEEFSSILKEVEAKRALVGKEPMQLRVACEMAWDSYHLWRSTIERADDFQSPSPQKITAAAATLLEAMSNHDKVFAMGISEFPDSVINMMFVQCVEHSTEVEFELVTWEIVRRFLCQIKDKDSRIARQLAGVAKVAAARELRGSASAAKPIEARFVRRLLEIWCEMTGITPTNITPGNANTPGPLLRYLRAASEPAMDHPTPYNGLVARARAFKVDPSL